eukprot:TRINITY_DN14233_c0_g5_i2.p1 TRINITY_DN14233_c0_g5~~TRINITY_DN14233_c0_g5_i2.p1  ORF type:complete len:1294 (-),score=168.87 TRINITY_DN14233_c0_g5_i2:359-4189(-)
MRWLRFGEVSSACGHVRYEAEQPLRPQAQRQAAEAVEKLSGWRAARKSMADSTSEADRAKGVGTRARVGRYGWRRRWHPMVPRLLFLAALSKAQSTASGDDSMLSEQTQDGVEVPFLRVGGGECLSDGDRPVQGRSKRDVGHSECRYYCNQDCVGYSYQPCSRTCTVHGQLAKLNLVPEEEGWITSSGGSRIVASTEKCGAACFSRQNPCSNGTIESAGIQVVYPPLSFDSTVYVPCPFPYLGNIEIRCGLTGITVLSGRCKRPCPPGTILDGNFEVTYEGILHGVQMYASCPDSAAGFVIMSCTDGDPWRVGGRCGYNCAPGSFTSGQANIINAGMSHNEQRLLTCPTNFTGQVKVECVDSYVSKLPGEGDCKKACFAGTKNFTVGEGARGVYGEATHPYLDHGQFFMGTCSPAQDLIGHVSLQCVDGAVQHNDTVGQCFRHCPAGFIGPGIKALPHGAIAHNASIHLMCAPGFEGDIEVTCWDGETYISEGECKMHCAAGAVVSNAVVLNHTAVNNGDYVLLDCPNETHNGVLNASCEDGQMRFYGTCGTNCKPDTISVGYATVSYDMIPHGPEGVEVPCPPPYVGNVTLLCYEGRSFYEGSCGAPCSDGRYRRNGAQILYTAMNHSQEKNYQCVSRFPGSGMTFSGNVTLQCVDGSIKADGSCYPDCGSGDIKSGGSDVYYPNLKDKESARVECMPDAMYGVVTVSCLEGLAQVTEGTCGRPCWPSPYTSRATRFTDVDVPILQHFSETWVPCPEELSGELLFLCENSLRDVKEGGCGERCEAESLLVFGASFVSPRMDHLKTYSQPCNWPFNGTVDLFCEYGNLNVTNNCRVGCYADTARVNGGNGEFALIDYPEMLDSVLFPATCPDGFSGDVVLQCWNGAARVYSGACNASCDAGTYNQASPPVELTHYPMVHGDMVERPCPASFSGSIKLRCERGKVEYVEGSCMRNCPRGSLFIRMGVNMLYGPRPHGDMYPLKLCPTRGYVGSIRMKCENGVVKHIDGECLAHCGEGKTTQGARYLGLAHGTNTSLQCPELGQVVASCNDGLVKEIGGTCIKPCPAGKLNDTNGTVVQYDSMEHLANTSGICSGFATGRVRVACNNTEVSIISSGADRCYRHCLGRNITFQQGRFKLYAPDTSHGQKSFVKCPKGEKGTIAFRCNDAVLEWADGSCGDANCREGSFVSGGATVPHPSINDRQEAGPMDCPAGYIGQGYFGCNNGSAFLKEVVHYDPVVPYNPNRTENGTNASLEELGLDPFDNRVMLCSCCTPPPLV